MRHNVLLMGCISSSFSHFRQNPFIMDMTDIKPPSNYVCAKEVWSFKCTEHKILIRQNYHGIKSHWLHSTASNWQYQKLIPGMECFSIDRSFAIDFLQLVRFILTCFSRVEVKEIF